MAERTDTKTVTFGRYQVLRRLATGGMAEVFLARATSVEGFQREVVVKRILPEYSSNADFVASFLSEAKLTAQLVHPHIAQVFDLGQVGDSYFLAMEYIKGYDLGIIINYEREQKGRVPVPIALRMMIDLCEGLDYAHEATDIDGKRLNIVHRDVTPSNLLVSMDGIAKLVDFGIAKATAAQSNDRRTATGTVKGKVSYMAPEQVLGKPLDRRVDVFAAGIVLYELLAGKSPFKSDSDFATLRNVIELVPPPPSAFGAPEVLDRVVARVLAKSPDERYASIADLLHDLEQTAAQAGLALSHGEVSRYLRQNRPGLDAVAERIAGGGGEISASFADDTRVTTAQLLPDLEVKEQKKSRVPLFAALASVLLLAAGTAVFWPKPAPPPPVEPPKVEAPPPVVIKTASVEVTTTPVGLAVVFDGTAKGPAPIIVENLAVGSHHLVECLQAGSVVAKVVVDTKAAERYNVRCDAPVREVVKKGGKRDKKEAKQAAAAPAPIAGSGSLRVIAKPIGAEVMIDGKRAGETPFPPVELKAGMHTVVIEHPDFGKKETKRVEISPDKESTIQVDFTR